MKKIAHKNLSNKHVDRKKKGNLPKYPSNVVGKDIKTESTENNKDEMNNEFFTDWSIKS